MWLILPHYSAQCSPGLVKLLGIAIPEKVSPKVLPKVSRTFDSLKSIARFFICFEGPALFEMVEDLYLAERAKDTS
jgi:hypothetical protein